MKTFNFKFEIICLYHLTKYFFKGGLQTECRIALSSVAQILLSQTLIYKLLTRKCLKPNLIFLVVIYHQRNHSIII